ncbi:MAG TPA: hypothetical protein VN718_03065 [Rhizomicrobium sp.]|nr:hypothetical protein [Rhizomicrobium sp.]
MRGFRLVNRDNLWVTKMPGALRDWQIKCVCGPNCNNGWMRQRIEEPAKPVLEKLMHGDQFRLSAKDQERVAAWAVLKAIIAEYDVGDHITTHHMQRKYLMRRFLPPRRNWAVWIGDFDRKDWKPEWISAALFGIPNPGPNTDLNKTPTYFNGHSTTQVLGKLFIQVLSLPIPGFVERWRFAMPDGGQLIRIWPPTLFSLKWPGPAMSDREADLTSSALDRGGRKAARRRLGLAPDAPHGAAS